MTISLVDIANSALALFGGAADSSGGQGFISASEISAGTTATAKRINNQYGISRQELITRFAEMKCPFRETRKFADLNDDLKADDISIESITVGVDPFPITVVTTKVHNLTNGNTRFLSDIRGDLATDAADVVSLNGKTVTITIVDTTSFTIDTEVGAAAWDHIANTGRISKAPEMGGWQYAFAIPSDYFCMVRQTNETPSQRYGTRREYQHDVILDRVGKGRVLLTNDLTNLGGDSAYIEYCIDQTTFAVFSPAYIECLIHMLAIKLCPNIGSRDLETRGALIAEFDNVIIPRTKAYNQSQFNNTAKVVPDFSGGRSSGGVGVGSIRNLGTYKDAQGNRREIFP